MLRRTLSLLIALILITMLATPMASASSSELSGRVIILDPGHGVGSTNIYAGYNEQVAMLRLALKIKPLLESRGATVRMTRPTGANVLLSVRCAMINIWALEAVKEARLRDANGGANAIAEIDRLISAMRSIVNNPGTNARIYMNSPFSSTRRIHSDMKKIFELQAGPEVGARFLAISLHSNATGTPINTSVNGADVFYISNSHPNTSNYYTGYSYEAQSRRFGHCLLGQIGTTGMRQRSVRSANYFLLREHNVPGVLAENGFHTNAGDRARLMDDRFLDKLAYAYLEAVTEYFDRIPLPNSYPTLPFSDVRYGDWYFDAVKQVSERGLLVGTSQNRFSPNAGMTRAMLATVLARFGSVNVSPYSEAPYTDVHMGTWYGKSVAWAADNGIVDFIGEHMFYPEQYVTREEIAVMIYNYLLWQEITPETVLTTTFIDEDDISPWAIEAVLAIRDYGIMQGHQNRFHPMDSATRAEVSQIFCNTMAVLEDLGW